MKRPERSPIALVPESRRAVLTLLKKNGWSTISALADALSISVEAVRQQLWLLEKEGWVKSDCGPEGEAEERMRGRPAARYCLSPLGDDLFPKQYAELTTTFFDSLADPIGVLKKLTDDRVRMLEDGENVEALRSIYSPTDEYTSIEKSDRGYRLIEKNCPYLTFATERPLFCSSTVSALRRLSGCEVVREKRFQDGDGECVFHIYTDRPLPPRRKSVRFEREPDKHAEKNR